MNKAIYWFCICLLSFAAIDGNAYEPLNTDDAGTVKKNGNQLELYFDIIHNNKQPSGPGQNDVVPGEDFIGRGSSSFFPFIYTRGIFDDVEASVGTTYYSTPRGNYSPISNNVIGVKWRYFGEDGMGLNLAVKPIIQLPVSNQQQVIGFGQAATNYGINFIASHYWGDIVQLHMNAMYMYSPYNPNYLSGGSSSPLRTNIYTLSAAPVLKVTDHLSLALDVGAQTNPPSTQQYSVLYGMVAAIVALGDDLDLGLSMQRSAQNFAYVLAGNGPNLTRSYMGLTWRFD